MQRLQFALPFHNLGSIRMALHPIHISGMRLPAASTTSQDRGGNKFLRASWRGQVGFFLGLALAMGFVSATPVAAAEYPSETIKIVVSWNAGGPVDIIARTLAEKMSESLKQQVIIEDKPGANGIVGTNFVAKSRPDGYTLLITTSAHALNAAMYETLPFDPVKDFEPITMMALTSGNLLVVRADSPVRTLAEFVDLARKSPGKFNYATNGLGNASHISGELLARAAKIEITPVHYKGTAPFVTDILGGHVQAGFISPVAGVPLVTSGQMRALALAGTVRTPSLPDVPTFKELGYPSVVLDSYYAAWFPAGTPKDRVNLIQKSIVAAMQSKEFMRLVKQSDLIVKGLTPDEFKAYLVEDVTNMKALMKSIDFHPLK
jgi:tripartite-type tricarboxylate transporter receptor subunit TctC